MKKFRLSPSCVILTTALGNKRCRDSACWACRATSSAPSRRRRQNPTHSDLTCFPHAWQRGTAKLMISCLYFRAGESVPTEQAKSPWSEFGPGIQEINSAHFIIFLRHSDQRQAKFWPPSDTVMSCYWKGGDWAGSVNSPAQASGTCRESNWSPGLHCG